VSEIKEETIQNFVEKLSQNLTDVNAFWSNIETDISAVDKLRDNAKTVYEDGVENIDRVEYKVNDELRQTVELKIENISKNRKFIREKLKAVREERKNISEEINIHKQKDKTEFANVLEKYTEFKILTKKFEIIAEFEIRLIQNIRMKRTERIYKNKDFLRKITPKTKKVYDGADGEIIDEDYKEVEFDMSTQYSKKADLVVSSDNNLDSFKYVDTEKDPLENKVELGKISEEEFEKFEKVITKFENIKTTGINGGYYKKVNKDESFKELYTEFSKSNEKFKKLKGKVGGEIKLDDVNKDDCIEEFRGIFENINECGRKLDKNHKNIVASLQAHTHEKIAGMIAGLKANKNTEITNEIDEKTKEDFNTLDIESFKEKLIKIIKTYEVDENFDTSNSSNLCSPIAEKLKKDGITLKSKDGVEVTADNAFVYSLIVDMVIEEITKKERKIKINKVKPEKKTLKINKVEPEKKIFKQKLISEKSRKIATGKYNVQNQSLNPLSCGPYAMSNGILNTQFIKNKPELRKLFNVNTILEYSGKGDTNLSILYNYCKTNLPKHIRPYLCISSESFDDYTVSLSNQNMRNFKNKKKIEDFIKDIIYKNKEVVFQRVSGKHFTSILYDIKRKIFIQFDSLHGGQYEEMSENEMVEFINDSLRYTSNGNGLMYVELKDLPKLKIKSK